MDDEPAIRETSAAILRQKGFSVDVAASGSEVLSKIRVQDFDFIITDYEMPEMDGLELARKLSEHGCPAVLVMYTAALTVPLAPGRELLSACFFKGDGQELVIKFLERRFTEVLNR